MTLSLGTLALGAFALLGIGLLCFNVFRWLVGSADKAVDERQEVYSRLGGLLDSWQLPRLGSICHKLAALNISGTIKEVRSLVDALMPGGMPDEKPMLDMLSKNFWHQLAKRFAGVEDRARIVKEALAHPETKAALIEALAAEKKVT